MSDFNTNLTSSFRQMNDTSHDPYFKFATTIHSTGCWLATIYIGLVAALITVSQTYQQYPGVALSWILYIEFASSLVYGPIMWWPASPFHVALAADPQQVGCSFIVWADTFFEVGVIYSATICAYGFYAVTSRMSFAADGVEGRRKKCIALVGFWVLSSGLAFLNIREGFHLDGWCQSNSKVFVGLKLGLILSLFLAQVFFVSIGLRRLGRLQRHLSSFNTETKQNARCNMHMAGTQLWLAIRFTTFLATQLISWIPLAYIEFFSVFFGHPLLEHLYFASIGHWVGGIIDATVLLFNNDLKRWMFPKSQTQVQPRRTKILRSTVRSTKGKELCGEPGEPVAAGPTATV